MISYASNVRTRGKFFYQAYRAARGSDDMHKLCNYITYMLCDMYDRFRSSLEETLHIIGVIPAVVWLPTDKEASDSLVWAFILVHFGCFTMVLLKKFIDEICSNQRE